MTTMTRDVESSVETVHLLMAFELDSGGGGWGSPRAWVSSRDATDRRWSRGRRAYGNRPREDAVQTPRGHAAWSAAMKRGVMGSGCICNLALHGVRNHVVDSSSIEVDRRARRRDHQLDWGIVDVAGPLDGGIGMLPRRAVPSVVDEDARQLHRTRETLQDRTRLINRLKGTLATLGARLRLTRDFLERVDAALLPDGTHGAAGRSPAACALLCVAADRVTAARRVGLRSATP